MSVTLTASKVKQNFGQVVDRALVDGDVIVERYGTPRVAIVEYDRYMRLLEAERSLLRTQLQQASVAAAARAAHLADEEVEALIDQARSEVQEVRTAV